MAEKSDEKWNSKSKFLSCYTFNDIAEIKHIDLKIFEIGAKL